MEPVLQKGMGFCFSPLTTYASRSRIRYAPYLPAVGTALCEKLVTIER